MSSNVKSIENQYEKRGEISKEREGTQRQLKREKDSEI